MTAAALTRRVRILVLCDEASPSAIEDGVFTLEGVRQHLHSDRFPCHYTLCVFLLLTCSRQGTYEGLIRVVCCANMRAVRTQPFFVTFRDDVEKRTFVTEVPNCSFPEPGEYTVAIWFTAPNGESAQKGELPIDALQAEE
jgi:hypothetical protein